MVNQPHRRSFLALYIAMAIMFTLLVGQLFNMQLIQGAQYQTSAVKNRERTVSTDAIRGIIYDRGGQKLVLNNPSYSVAVTPSDLPDINCGAGQLEGSEIFPRLAATLATSDVIALKPSDLPPDKMTLVANLLSVPLQVNKNILLTAMQEIKDKWPTSERLFLLRSDVPVEAGKVLRDEVVAKPEDLPGIRIYNELEYNFLTRYATCLEPIVVKRGVDYKLSLQTEVTRLVGVSVVPEAVRVYPNSSYFSHLLGYVGQISREGYETNRAVYAPDDKVGQVGLEAALEEQLRGQKGEERFTVNAQEQIVEQIFARAPVTGNNVALTIDSALQMSVTQALQRGLDQAKVKAGVAIVMRVTDGQILSMVSLPSYDNNLFSAGISQSAFDTLNNDPALPMFNRAVGGAYPPGSTYKMISASAALQEGVVTPATTFNCPGYIEVPFTYSERTRNPYRDWRPGGHGTINVVQALTVSSDVFFYIAAGPRAVDRTIHNDDGTDTLIYTRYYNPGGKTPIEFNGLGIDRLNKYARAYGFGTKTGVELPGEVPGLAPDPAWKLATYPDNPWALGDTLVTAIGQGFALVTPLQLVNSTAAVANGGTLYRPQLVLNVTDPAGKIVQDYKPQVLGQVPVSPENLAIVREGMRQVVADKKGTAYSKITLKSVQVAGKTGTAEFGDPIRIVDKKEVRRAHAWFTAFAPYDKPEIAVVVLLEGGEESLEGSTFAVPVADEILKAYFHVEK
jgi:penicillin-binding protein 2